jgi:hypothetical protein
MSRYRATYPTRAGMVTTEIDASCREDVVLNILGQDPEMNASDIVELVDITDPTGDPDARPFTPEDDALLGVVEPDDPTTSAPPGVVDPATAEAERADRIARITAVLVATGADPDDLRFFARQLWMQGWLAGWNVRGAPRAGISRNPYDVAGEHPDDR